MTGTGNSTPTDEIEVRALQSNDAAAVTALGRRLTIGVAAWRSPAAVSLAARQWVTESLANAGQEGHAVLVAVMGGRVVGFVSLAERRHFTSELDAYIGELVTDEVAEGRGIGRALMTEAEEWARARGLAKLTLETGAANTRARRFYRRCGFREEDLKLTKCL